ncbi:TlpA family protein disulfide reductase [Pedobacter borealis]|uniref:TlpA family protein disulfide reductase n=1 Tax=Pedobacter borealis TaxID=475254 RepID=UPI00068DE53E|nr:redoxin domain-containing protein [Pedobacter borealis]
MKTIKLLILLIFSFNFVNAQIPIKDLPVIGKKCPDFYLSDINYFTSKTATLSDFKGKWLILDFWNRYCTVCLNSMPKMSNLQSNFKGKAQVVMVGYTGSKYYKSAKEPDDKQIRKLYEMNREEFKLSLTVAYDSVLFSKFDIGSCPYIVVANPDGIVKAITSRISEAQLDSLMRDLEIHPRRVYNSTESRERKRQATQ